MVPEAINSITFLDDAERPSEISAACGWECGKEGCRLLSSFFGSWVAEVLLGSREAALLFCRCRKGAGSNGSSMLPLVCAKLLARSRAPPS